MQQKEIHLRTERRHKGVAPKRAGDKRDEFQRDRDRILHSSAFRRLGGVTQVIRAGESDVFHTRLAHTLKVAQIGRRLVEKLGQSQPKQSSRLSLNPDVVEAACLAHDLGHPPFGHAGEKRLSELVIEKGDSDGFEGNAQSLRVVTKLSARYDVCLGLNLTRATLSAILKYPWHQDNVRAGKKKKWGAYVAEKDDFAFARMGYKSSAQAPEAEIMDWSDDIAYSVHDMEDFHRCQSLPWYAIATDDGKDALVKSVIQQSQSLDKETLELACEAVLGFIRVVAPQLVKRPYEGLWSQRIELRHLTSQLITRYMLATRIDPESLPDVNDKSILEIAPMYLAEVSILKQLTRNFIINNPTLASQQRGQGRIVTELFEELYEDIGQGRNYVPKRFFHIIQSSDSGEISRARAVSDCISSMSEAEAFSLHQRLRGYAAGSALDPIVR